MPSCNGVKTGIPARSTGGDPARLSRDSKRRPAVRAEFLRLCPASRRRLPLFGGPEVLSSRRALLRARGADRRGRASKETSFAHFPANFLPTRSTKLSSACSIAASSCRWARPTARRPPIGRASGSSPKPRRRTSERFACGFNRSGPPARANWTAALRELRGPRRRSPGRPDRRPGRRLSRRPACGIQQPSGWRKSKTGCWCSRPEFFPWSVRSSVPGKSACWTCLADRMKWNRQIKAFLDRKEARCVAVSPLGRECARAERDRACGGRDRQGHRQWFSHRPAPPYRQPRPDGLDGRRGTSCRPRPQCPSCGSKEAARPGAARLCRSGFGPAARSS